MATSFVTLDTTQYVRINIGYKSMILQAHNDSVRVVVSELKPVKGNTAYHTLGGGDAPLHLNIVNDNVWVLAVTDKSSLIVTESTTSFATEETVSQLVMTVTNALDFTTYDLNAAAFSEATNITNDYELDNVEFNFSTAESKTITITTADGTVILNEADNTDTSFTWQPSSEMAFNGGENLTVAVTQFTAAGIMDCILKIKQGSNSLLGNPTVSISTKKYCETDPDFFKPRGHMFTLSMEISGYDFGGTDITDYPTVGVNLLWGAGVAPGHGVYIVPGPGQVAYLQKIVLFYNHTAKGLVEEQYKDRISGNPSSFQGMHNGSAFCSADTPLKVTTISDSSPSELTDFLGTNQFFYSQDLPAATPGRFDGDNGDSFGFRFSGGNGVYLGNSFAANKLSHFHFTFIGWIVDKIGGEEVIRHLTL